MTVDHHDRIREDILIKNGKNYGHQKLMEGSSQFSSRQMLGSPFMGGSFPGIGAFDVLTRTSELTGTKRHYIAKRMLQCTVFGAMPLHVHVERLARPLGAKHCTTKHVK